MTQDTTPPELVPLRDRYLKALHAMQSGVAFDADKRDQEPKHLRVGVNATKCDHAGLVRLLIAKGFITEVEYYTAMAESMEREADEYADRISKQMGGTKVTLA